MILISVILQEKLVLRHSLTILAIAFMRECVKRPLDLRAYFFSSIWADKLVELFFIIMYLSVKEKIVFRLIQPSETIS